MQSCGLIYQYKHVSAHSLPVFKRLALALVAFALGGVTGPLTPTIRLETAYLFKQAKLAIQPSNHALPPSVPVVFSPLVTPDGSSISPVNTDFSLIIPKIGVNAAVIPAVNPADAKTYGEVLKHGIAHASTSYFPGQGTTYLFSHSTNYDWFVSDLNAVFYHLKNLTEGDTIVLFYKGKQFTYRLTEKKVVAPSEISYLVGAAGDKRLILQTCWPPGSTSERLLIFAELVQEEGQSI
ncbi:sortase [Candidatus Gottesmanbacteria bacterium]|nr:sortase [Candidatus Gottesmanbacteria bacterium]